MHFEYNKGSWFKNVNTQPGGQVACCYVEGFFPHQWYSSVLQVSKTKTTCHSYKLSIKIDVPEGIERKKNVLKCSGPSSHPCILCECILAIELLLLPWAAI